MIIVHIMCQCRRLLLLAVTTSVAVVSSDEVEADSNAALAPVVDSLARARLSPCAVIFRGGGGTGGGLEEGLAEREVPLVSLSDPTLLSSSSSLPCPVFVYLSSPATASSPSPSPSSAAIEFGSAARQGKKKAGASSASLLVVARGNQSVDFDVDEVLGSEGFSGAGEAFVLKEDSPGGSVFGLFSGGFCSKRNGDSGGGGGPNPIAIWDGRTGKFLGDDGGGSQEEEANPFSRETATADFSCRFVRAVTFEYEPFITASKGYEGKHGGFEVLIFLAVAEKLGFDYEFAPPSDGGKWGEEVAPGNFTGLIGELQNGRADVGFANLFMIPNRRRTIDYSDAYEVDYVCFMLRKPSALPQWTALVTAFPLSLWAAVLASAASSFAFAAAYSAFHPRSEAGPALFVTSLAGMLVDESQPIMKKIKSIPIKIFMGGFIGGIMILNNVYKGELTTKLSLTLVPSPIDTMEALASQKDFPVTSFGDTFRTSVMKSIDPVLQLLSTKYDVHYDFGSALYNASQGLLAMGEGRMFLDYSVRKDFTNSYGETSMHIMRECLNSYQVAYALQKDSPLTQPFTSVIHRLKEGGFVGKWIRDEMEKVAHLSPDADAVSVSATAWSVPQLQGPFLAYIVCMVAAAAVLGLEEAVAAAAASLVQLQEERRACAAGGRGGEESQPKKTNHTSFSLQSQRTRGFQHHSAVRAPSSLVSLNQLIGPSQRTEGKNGRGGDQGSNTRGRRTGKVAEVIVATSHGL